MHTRKYLSADGMIASLRSQLNTLPDKRRQGSVAHSLTDVCMSAFAMFSLKHPSLLDYERHYRDEVFSSNINTLYGVKKCPSDSQMREILDEVDPSQLQGAYKQLFSDFQRGKGLEKYEWLGGKYLVALDGTSFFSSKDVHCDNCLVRESKSGEITYSHQMLGAVLVHPDHKEVFPFYPEPIMGTDGNNKNDCERNASMRWLAQFRKDHPKLPVIIVEDGLASNAPHIRCLQDHNCSFILGAKPGDHRHLFEQVKAAETYTDLIGEKTLVFGEGKRTLKIKLRYLNGVPINASNPDLRVNFLECTEEKNGKITVFTWVTDILIDDENVYDLMRGGRARWRIENETFNTLKNQGYNFEHNYGHGRKNLATVLAHLMFLAFFVDQIQQSCCRVFQAAMHTSSIKRTLWERVRSWFVMVSLPSWRELFLGIAHGATGRAQNTT